MKEESGGVECGRFPSLFLSLVFSLLFLAVCPRVNQSISFEIFLCSYDHFVSSFFFFLSIIFIPERLRREPYAPLHLHIVCCWGEHRVLLERWSLHYIGRQEHVRLVAGGFISRSLCFSTSLMLSSLFLVSLNCSRLDLSFFSFLLFVFFLLSFNYS